MKNKKKKEPILLYIAFGVMFFFLFIGLDEYQTKKENQAKAAAAEKQMLIDLEMGYWLYNRR
ncbi:hypothetical protein N9K20_01340 [Methylophilaceae bacterium]|nr:hypothetical protein [Methylophilaceae bacterium]